METKASTLATNLKRKVLHFLQSYGVILYKSALKDASASSNYVAECNEFAFSDI